MGEIDELDKQAPVVDGGRRRPPRWLTVAAASVAVVAIAVGGAVALSRGDDGEAASGAQPQRTTSQADQAMEELPEGVAPADTRTQFPNPDMPLGPDGLPLVDGLVTSGPRYEQGARLLAELIAVVPAGYTVPATDSAPLGPDTPTQEAGADPFARSHRTMWVQKVDGVDVWMSEASLAVSAGPDTGTLIVMVNTPGSPGVDDVMCAQVDAEPDSDCQRVDVGGREVTLFAFTGEPGGMQRAAHTHPDGTIVSVMQLRDNVGDGRNALPQPIFSTQQLVELAVDGRFLVA